MPTTYYQRYSTTHVVNDVNDLDVDAGDGDHDDDDVDAGNGENRTTLVLRLRRPSRNLEERLARLESASFNHEERLKFLDPELKSTHNRIEVIESVCEANTSELLRQGPFNFTSSSLTTADLCYSPQHGS